jgi:hypothetical protein
VDELQPRHKPLENNHQCDFCGDLVQKDDTQATIYGCDDMIDHILSIGYRGGWLACKTCAAFIRQFDSGELDAKANLTRRALEKYRRKYGLRGIPATTVNAVLKAEIESLFDRFWRNRRDEAVPYSTLKLEG